jgi:hypothetical protein
MPSIFLFVSHIVMRLYFSVRVTEHQNPVIRDCVHTNTRTHYARSVNDTGKWV